MEKNKSIPARAAVFSFFGREKGGKILFLSLFFLLSLCASAAGRAKYVFLFIGDGMGVNQVNGTETYLAALEGRIGVKPLLFAQFPCAALVTTYSSVNGVTDSAAAGTALSTGKKTKNGTLGLLPDLKTPAYSVACWAQRAGAAVGVATSVSVDHATPAAFYAHQPRRKMYHEIGLDLPKAGFDFYAGSDFLKPLPDGAAQGGASLYDICRKAGYTLARGYADYQKQTAQATKMLLFQTEAASQRERNSLPYAIDRTPEDMTLAEITRAGIDFLTKREKDGFFLMVEGGKIDWACHANDAATAFREVVDMDEAVKVAYDFYQKHPDETLIVITADHETGGIALGRGPYELHLDLLENQRMSAEAYSAHVKELHARLGAALTWEAMQADLQEQWGFGGKVKLTDAQTARLKAAYEAVSAEQGADKKSLYASVDALADAAREVMAEQALVGWQSRGHSNGYVPAFAVGAGSEAFRGQIDNTQIPLLLAKAAGWQVF